MCVCIYIARFALLVLFVTRTPYPVHGIWNSFHFTMLGGKREGGRVVGTTRDVGRARQCA